MQELWPKVYKRDSAHFHAARIIHYAGCSPSEFFDAAKKIPGYDKYRFENAVNDLTSWKARQPPTLRYEFTPQARKVVKALLGPPPESPEYEAYWSREVFQPGMSEPFVPGKKPEAEKPKKSRRKVK